MRERRGGNETAAEKGNSKFFYDLNKIKELAFRSLVKIAQGHQKGHHKILKQLTITLEMSINGIY